MAKAKRKEPTPSAFDLVREAVERGGYPHTIEQDGDNTIMTIEVAPNVRTAAVFDRQGRAVPPPGVRELIERVLGSQTEPQEPPAPESIESVMYDVDALGGCSDEEPCQGLQTLMAASCVEHGGVLGLAHGTAPKLPDLIGYLPTQGHRRGHLLAFNFCPCCGRDYRGDTVLGSEGPTTIQ